MVHVSRAILTASLALSAAAPTLAVPLFSTPGGTFLRFGDSGHGHLIRALVDLTAAVPPVYTAHPPPQPAAAQEPPPAAASGLLPPYTAPAAPVGASTASQQPGVVQGFIIPGALSLLGAGVLGSAVYGIIKATTRRAVDDETYLAMGKEGLASSFPLEKKNDANFSVAQDK